MREMGAICQIGVFTAERSIFLVQKRSFSAFSHYVLSETPPDVFAQKRPILNGQLCRVFLCIFPRKIGFFAKKIRVNQHHAADPKMGQNLHRFPAKNANLTNGTSFVFLGNLKPDFSTKMDIFGSIWAEVPNFAVLLAQVGQTLHRFPASTLFSVKSNGTSFVFSRKF